MHDMTILQLDNMIHSLKQKGLFRPEYTIEEAYIVWKSIPDMKKK